MLSLRNFAFGCTAVFTALVPTVAQETPKGTAHMAPKLSVAEIKQISAVTRGPLIKLTPCACLKEYVDWAKQNNGENWYYLTYTLSLVATGGFHNYSEGYLNWNAARGIFEHSSADGDQEYVNTFRDAAGHPWLGGTAGVGKLNLDINPISCTATVHYGHPPLSASVANTVPLQCNNGVFYGFSTSPSTPGAARGWMITLKKMSMPIPR
jgi:hypothetical protein